jgi:mycoredoxin
MLVVYGTSWCSDCAATRQALQALGIPFEDIDIDRDPEAERKVLEVNQGRRSVPTLVYRDRAASMSRFSIAKLRAFLAEVGLLER